MTLNVNVDKYADTWCRHKKHESLPGEGSDEICERRLRTSGDESEDPTLSLRLFFDAEVVRLGDELCRPFGGRMIEKSCAVVVSPFFDAIFHVHDVKA